MSDSDDIGSSYSSDKNVCDFNKGNGIESLPMKSRKIYNCGVCEKKFTLATNRQRHEKTIHDVKFNRKPKYNCAICNHIYSSRTNLLNHIKENHTELYKYEQLEFATLCEFNIWKTQIEQNTLSSYISSVTYETRTDTIRLYSCHRSGHFESRGKGIRQLKLTGTNKIESYCPAHIYVKIDKLSNGVFARFFSSHMGHDFEVNRLRLSKFEKAEIAEQLSSGMSVQSILNNIAEASPSSQRLATLKAQDIRNISMSYGLDVSSSKDKVFEHHFKSIINKSSNHFPSKKMANNLIKKMHEEAEKIKDNVVIFRQNDDTWIITHLQDDEDEENTFVVKKIKLKSDHKCSLMCDVCNICLHKLACNCPNSAIECNMCEHIHVICMEENITEADDFLNSDPPDDFESCQVSDEDVLDNEVLTKLKEKAISVTMSVMSEIEHFTTEEQYKEFINIMTNIKQKYKDSEPNQIFFSEPSVNDFSKESQYQRNVIEESIEIDPQYEVIETVIISNQEDALLLDHDYNANQYNLNNSVYN